MFSKNEIRKWLLGKGTTLWGQFDLSQPTRVDAAVDWFHSQVESLSVYSGMGLDTKPQVRDVDERVFPYEPPRPPPNDGLFWAEYRVGVPGSFQQGFDVT